MLAHAKPDDHSRRCLASEEASGVISSLVDVQLETAMSFIRTRSEELGGGRGHPVARLIPIIADAFGEVTAS